MFRVFDSERAANTTYPDSRFTELQALMALGGCGTPQGQSRMETFFGEEYTPHGDTHLRTIKQYPQEQIQAGFEQSITNLLNAVNYLQILQPPVTVAIDITTWPYHAEDDIPAEVSGTDESGELAYKFATLSLVGKSMPIVLADRGFESLQVYQTLDNLDVTYLFPKIERAPETAYIKQMEQEDEDGEDDENNTKQAVGCALGGHDEPIWMFAN